jgi:DNA-binding transcriptional ArsR family regulator
MDEKNLDECLKLVSDTQRRRVVQRLREKSTGKTTIEDLVDHLHGSNSPAVTDRRLDRSQLSLQLAHTHLPKLADHGVIEIDSDVETVRYQSDEQVEAVLDSLSGNVHR